MRGIHFYLLLRSITPTFDYLPWKITHSLEVCIQSLTTTSEGRIFSSVVRALDFYPGRMSLNLTIGSFFPF